MAKNIGYSILNRLPSNHIAKIKVPFGTTLYAGDFVAVEDLDTSIPNNYEVFIPEQPTSAKFATSHFAMVVSGGDFETLVDGRRPMGQPDFTEYSYKGGSVIPVVYFDTHIPFEIGVETVIGGTVNDPKADIGKYIVPTNGSYKGTVASSANGYSDFLYIIGTRLMPIGGELGQEYVHTYICVGADETSITPIIRYFEVSDTLHTTYFNTSANNDDLVDLYNLLEGIPSDAGLGKILFCADTTPIATAGSIVPFEVGETYDKVYFDTSKSIEEMETILSGLEYNDEAIHFFIDDENEDNRQFIIALSLKDLGYDDYPDGYVIGDQNNTTIFSTTVWEQGGITVAGWQTLDGEYAFDDAITPTVVDNQSFMSAEPILEPIGGNVYAPIVSLNVVKGTDASEIEVDDTVNKFYFNTSVIPDLSELAENDYLLKGDVSKSVSGATPFVVGQTYNAIYWDTNKTVEEMNALLPDLVGTTLLVVGGIDFFVTSVTYEGETNPIYIIGAAGGEAAVYRSAVGGGYTNVGWDSETISLINEEFPEDAEVSQANNQPFMSATPFGGSQEIETNHTILRVQPLSDYGYGDGYMLVYNANPAEMGKVIYSDKAFNLYGLNVRQGWDLTDIDMSPYSATVTALLGQDIWKDFIATSPFVDKAEVYFAEAQVFDANGWDTDLISEINTELTTIPIPITAVSDQQEDWAELVSPDSFE